MRSKTIAYQMELVEPVEPPAVRLETLRHFLARHETVEYPKVPAFPRDDGVPGWQMFCPFCNAWHYHGVGLGHRVAHCAKETPFSKIGYILTVIPPGTNPAVESEAGPLSMGLRLRR